MSAADAEEVDTAAQAAFASLAGKAPALYVGVWDPDKGFFTKAYGEAVTGATPASVGDSLRIGSMTNAFTATVVLQLVREEELALSDSVEERLPELATQYPAARGGDRRAVALDEFRHPRLPAASRRRDPGDRREPATRMDHRRSSSEKA